MSRNNKSSEWTIHQVSKAGVTTAIWSLKNAEIIDDELLLDIIKIKTRSHDYLCGAVYMDVIFQWKGFENTSAKRERYWKSKGNNLTGLVYKDFIKAIEILYEIYSINAAKGSFMIRALRNRKRAR